MNRSSDEKYWHRLEGVVLSLAQDAADVSKRLRPRTVTSLGVSGTSGVPFFHAESASVMADILFLFTELTHNFRMVAPGLFTWDQDGEHAGMVRLGVVQAEVLV